MAIPKIQPYSLDTVQANFPNRTNWTINPEKSVLLVHDMQKYFVDFFDQSQAPINTAITHIQQLTHVCRQQQIPVIYTAQPGDQTPEDRALLTDFWGPGLKSDPAKTNIIDSLAPHATDISLTKWRYSAFQRTGLLELMKEAGCNQLVICGVYAHIGILTTALEAFMNDIQVFVVSDAVADFSLEEHRMAVNYIAQRCGYVTTMKDACKQLAAGTQLSTDTLTKQRILNDVATRLHLTPDDITDTDNLLFAGLDSITMMALVEQWKAIVPSLSFALLAEHTTVAQWHEIIMRHTTMGRTYDNA